MAGLYVHIPFCAQKCRYCDFPSYAGEASRVPSYVRALMVEINARSKEFEGVNVSTVFIGGGTPSLIDAREIAAVLKCLNDGFKIDSDAEITIEANPGTLTNDKLDLYRDAGVNRLSMGLQSASDELLQNLGRIHTRKDFETAYAMALKAGFSNINVDVMHGLMNQSVDDYLKTLEYVGSFAPTHVSAYALIVEEHTPLYDDVIGKKVMLPDADTVADMQDAGIAFLEKSGYERYEISNFAKGGFECRHNKNYWQNGDYIGFGLGAHSAMHVGGRFVRFSNPHAFDEYAKAVELPCEFEEIPHEEEMFETVMLGLRMCDGFSLSGFLARFGKKFEVHYASAVDKLKKSELLRVDEKRAFLTAKGMDLQNTVLMEFLG